MHHSITHHSAGSHLRHVEKETGCIFNFGVDELWNWKIIEGDPENQEKKRRRSVAVGLMVACAMKKVGDVQALMCLLAWHSVLLGHKEEDRLFSC